METGVFLTRDPAGFVDGPNLYTYVNQNPWTKFDPEGLQEAPADNSAMSLRNDLLSDGNPEAAAQIQRGKQAARDLTGALKTSVDVAGMMTGADMLSEGLGESLGGQKVSKTQFVAGIGITVVGGKIFKKVGEKLVELSKGAAKKLFELTGGKITKTSIVKTAGNMAEESAETVTLYHRGHLDKESRTELHTVTTREEAEALKRDGPIHEATITKEEFKEMERANQVIKSTVDDQGVPITEQKL